MPWRIVVLWGIALWLYGCGSGPPPRVPPSQVPTYYTVRQGDTIWSIAWRHHTNYRAVARINGIRAPYTIYPGQKLRLKAPPGRASGSTNRPGHAQANAKARSRPSPKKQSRARSVAAPSWRWPAEGKVIRAYSHAHNGKKGIDIAGNAGQSVRAASAGRVVYAGSGLKGYGRLIIIKHNNRYLSAYAHNRKLLVGEGERVASGQQIAELGATDANRPKLHFEIRRDGKPVDPLKYLPKR